MKNWFRVFTSILFFSQLLFPFTSFAYTWKPIATGTAQSFYAVEKQGTQLLVAGNSGKVLISDDSGKTWSEKTSGNTTYYDLGKLKTGEWIAIGQGGVSVSSSDNGKTWSQYSFGTTRDLTHLSAKGESGYLVGSAGRMYFYANSVWNLYTTSLTEDLYASFDLGDNKTGWIGGKSGLIWKTFTGGTSWSVEPTGTTETIRGIYFASAANGFAVGTKGTLLKTTDGGSSWSSVSVNGLTDQALYAIEGNGDVLVAVGDKIALVSEDAGKTWTAQSFAAENYTFFDVSNNGGSDIWAVGTKDGVSSVVYQLVRGEGTTPVTPAPSTSIPEGVPGSLIKMSCSSTAGVNDPCKAVYFYATDGKRHAFPNEKVFYTWYKDFSSVKEVSATFMASLSLGKNVTYHSGTRMVKFQTVPQVYAVQKGGVLRPIVSESVAAGLYGADWNKKIDDIADVFLNNYTFGATVNVTTDFDVIAAQAWSGTLSENF